MSADAEDPRKPGTPAGPADAAGARRLRLLSFQGEVAAVGGDQTVLRLVREYKGPTVSAVLRAAPATLSRLPGRVCSVLDAIDRGDLAAADRRLDAALNVLPGPGHARRASWRLLLPWLLAMWTLAAIATAVALVVA